MNILQLFVFVVMSSAYLSSQSTIFAIEPDKKPEITVSGGSTLHDWKVQSGNVLGYPAELSIDPAGIQIEKFSFQVEVESMDGGRGSTMNNKTYKALLSDTHPMIIYEQEGGVNGVVPDQDGNFILNPVGWITIAGVRKQVNVTVSGTLKEGRLTFQGNKGLLMSDFNIDPPSAMFGQIQTKDDITVSFSFTYVAK